METIKSGAHCTYCVFQKYTFLIFQISSLTPDKLQNQLQGHTLLTYKNLKLLKEKHTPYEPYEYQKLEYQRRPPFGFLRLMN